MKKLITVALAIMLVFSMSIMPASAAHTPEALLKSIHHLAEEGGILNCDFQLRDSFDELKNEYGRPNRNDFVASAHGNYATYSHHSFVVGYSNQEEIFELRSYSSRLSAITERNVTTYFGTPDHTAKADGDRVISYVMKGGYHIKFVFDGESADSKLNHYNVIWIDGTKNDRADDHGRKW